MKKLLKFLVPLALIIALGATVVFAKDGEPPTGTRVIITSICR